MKYRKKRCVRFRGSKTHGWGAMKKHRGSGNRGGVGMAGAGKRAAQKKPMVIKMYGTSYFGKKGFKSIRKKGKAINIETINKNLGVWVKENKISVNNDCYTINLNALGFDKLLGKGFCDKKLNIIIKCASKNAVKKIEAAGGKVNEHITEPS